MHWVYILYSKSLDRFYVGETFLSPEERLIQHNTNYYPDKFTKAGKPWMLFFKIKCESEINAKEIEKHIKNMKSKKYINDLVKYPDMISKLIEKYENRRLVLGSPR